MTYNRDLQEDKQHIFNAADTTGACLCMAEAICKNTAFDVQHIAAGLEKGFLDATALAEYLVNKGVPFRQAHGIVGALVAQCEKEGKDKLSAISLAQFQSACVKIEEDVYQTLNPAGVCRQYQSEGSAGFAQTRDRINYWQEKLKKQ